MAKLSRGDLAPDFRLQGTRGTFTLSEHRGERVVLLFYPGDDTPVCTRQFCSYRDRSDEFREIDATIVGLSTGDAAAKLAFQAKHGLTVELLADEGGAVAQAYGVFAKRVGRTKRAAVIVDEHGRVAHVHVNPFSVTYDDVDALRDALDALPSRSAAA